MQRKRISLILLTIAMVLVAGEIVAWSFFSLYGKDRLRWNEKLDAEALLERAISQARLPVRSEFQQQYMSPRKTPKQWRRGIAVAYGDSFTYGSQVADNETWPYYLSEFVQANVLNYGRPGFGTDEAVLKLEDNLQAGQRTRIVILAILSENIGRVVTSFPALFFLDERHRYFKPIILDAPNGEFRWQREYLNQLHTETGRQFAVELTRKHDFWYTYNKNRLEFTFPYLVLSFKTAHYLAFKHTNWGDLWTMTRPVAVMREIVLRFYHLSQEYDFTPVLVFIPAQIDTIRMERHQRLTYEDFIASLRADDDLKGLSIIDVAKEFPADFAPRQFNLGPHSGHASPAGNRVIAGAIARHLKH